LFAFYSIFNDVINTATKLQVTMPRVRIPVGERYIHFLQKLPDWLLGPPCLQWLQGSFSWAKYPDRKVTHSSASSDRLRMSRAVLLLPSVTSKRGQGPLTFIYLCH